MDFRILTIIAAALSFASCAVDEIKPEEEAAAASPSGNTILTAKSSEKPNPKAAFTDAGNFSWSASDEIAVWTTKSAFRRFTLYEGAGEATGKFSGTLTEETTSTVAVYPYSDGHALEGKKLTVNLPASYVWSADANAHAPMISLLEDGGEELDFVHVGGFVKIGFSSVPDAARKMVFTVEGRRISGDFIIPDISAANPVIATSEGSEGNSVTVDFSAPSSEMNFYIPLPTGSYPGFKVQLQDAAGESLVVRYRANAFNVERRDMILMGNIGGAAFNHRKLLFDFGHKNDANCPATASPDGNGNHWNNIENDAAGEKGKGTSFNLVYSNGDPTPYTLTLVTNFWSNGSANGGLTEAKWSSTTSQSLGDLAVGTATQDYFFVQGENTVCTFKLTGLDAAKGYKFHFFGSRSATAANQKREARYSVNGVNEFTGLLTITGPANGQQNTDDVLVSDIIYPNQDGSVSVSLSKGSNTQTSNHYYQLNCMKVEEYEGGLIPVSYDYTGLSVTSAEETFEMHRADTDGYVFEGVSTFAAGEVSMTATTSKGKSIDLTANCEVSGLAYLVADLGAQSFTFTPIPGVLAEGSALNGWSNTNGAALSYDGHGVFSGENLVFAGTNYNSKTAVSDPSRFNFLFTGSWDRTFQRGRAGRNAIESSKFNYEGAININPGTYNVTLNLRDFTFAIEPAAIDPDRITVMGSSVPRGIGATDNYGYMWLYNDILDGLGNWYISNISVSGNNTTNLLDRYDELVTDGAPYVVYALSLGNEGIHEASDKNAVYNQWKTNMQTLVSKARADGKTVVVTGNYARADFSEADYTAVKNMNLEIHQWDMPSVNLLGAIDNGEGRWASGYDAGDTYHPNGAGHAEMALTIPPTLFDALKAGKALPVRDDSGSKSLSGRQVIDIHPQGTIHPFTVSFGVKTTASGAILSFFNGENLRSVNVTDGGTLNYDSISGSTTVADGAWHQVTLTHFYARGETVLYVDGVRQGSLTEKILTDALYVGYAAADVTASFREVFFWRSGMNDEEIEALQDGAMLKSSLEVYAPLAGGSLDNKAQSTNVISLADGSSIVPAEDNSPKFGTAPFVEISTGTYQAIASLTQGQSVAVTGFDDIADWTIDEDFFTTISAGNYTLVPVSGYYKITADSAKKYFGVSRAADASGADATLASDGTGAVWLIGGPDIYGKPEIFPASWNPSYGLCLAETSPKIHKISFVAGTNLAMSTGYNLKFFFQKGWGDEFNNTGDHKISSRSLLVSVREDGCFTINSGFELGATYTFTLDLSAGTTSAVLYCEKTKESSIVSDKITVNGTELTLSGEGEYSGIAQFTKGGSMTITGVDNLTSYWINPDLYDNGAFNGVSGYYKITVNTSQKWISGGRINQSGSSPVISEGGLFWLGWGLSSVSHASQPGWNPGKGAQFVEVSAGIFQFTGIAGDTSSPTPGVRIRESGWDGKYYGGDGWYGEVHQGVNITGNAAANITQVEGGNLRIATALEIGATYRFTVDFTDCTISGNSWTGTETIIFEKL